MLDEPESEIDAKLERLFAETRPISTTPAASAMELEERLLEAFDRERGPTKKKARPLMKNTWFRRGFLAAAAAAVLGIAACAAPVDVDVQVGVSISIAYDAKAADAPTPKQLADFVQTTIESDLAAKHAAKHAAKTEAPSVSVEIALENGLAAVHAEVWGGDDEGLPAFAPRVKAAFPALADVEIKEETLHATVRESLATKLGHDVLDLDLDHADVETARKEVMARLRARGVEGKIDVDVRGGPDQRTIRVKVEKDKKSPSQDPGAP